MLKSSAKPVPQNRKRRKIDVFQYPTEDPPKTEEKKQEEVKMPVSNDGFRDITPQVMQSRRKKAEPGPI